MNTVRNIALIVAAAIGLLLLIRLLFPPAATGDSGDGNPGGENPAPNGSGQSAGIPCQNIPDNLPRYQTAATPPGAKAYLNVSDADWTQDFEARLRGFFLAVDVEPSDFTMKYFGAKLIWQYLNSPEGQLPDLLVLKASKRCGSIVGVPSQDMPKPAFCLSFTSGNWLEPTYQGGKDAHSESIRAVFGISKSKWTAAMQSRVKGFFKAVNIEPSEYNAKGLSQWYNRKPALEYLSSALGGLPDTLIIQGCMRCDGKSDQFINDL